MSVSTVCTTSLASPSARTAQPSLELFVASDSGAFALPSPMSSPKAGPQPSPTGPSLGPLVLTDASSGSVFMPSPCASPSGSWNMVQTKKVRKANRLLPADCQTLDPEQPLEPADCQTYA